MRIETEEEATAAVLQNGRNLQHVPFNSRSAELCLLAVQGTGWALEHVPLLWRDDDLCLTAVSHIGCALMFVPEDRRTLAICKAAFTSDEDCLKYVPEDKRWIASHLRNEILAKGYLLTVHCDCQSWQVDVTDIGGNNVVAVQAQPQELLRMLLARLQKELDDVPCTFMLSNGQFLNDWKDNVTLEVVMSNCGMLPGCLSECPV